MFDFMQYLDVINPFENPLTKRCFCLAGSFNDSVIDVDLVEILRFAKLLLQFLIVVLDSLVGGKDILLECRFGKIDFPVKQSLVLICFG